MTWKSAFLRNIFVLLISFTFAGTLLADCGGPPPPPPPLSSLLCNDIIFVSLDGNDPNHAQGGYNYQFTNSNGYKPYSRGTDGICQGWFFGFNQFDLRGKHILLEISAAGPNDYPGKDPNADRAKIRLLLGPNLRFEDGSREITAHIPRTPQFKQYLDVIPTVDCQAVVEAARHPTPPPPPPPPPPVLVKLPPLRTFPCPELPVIRNDVREINRIASRLALDDGYYQAAAEDMLVFGYSSRFAWLAFTGDESSIVAAFANPALSQDTRASVVANTRKKADFRQKLATAMFVYSQGQTYHPPETGDEGITDDVAAYLCNADPAKMDVPGWDALYHAGYIASPLYNNVRAKIQANAVMGPIVMAATMDLAPLALGILRIPALAARVAVSAEDVGILKNLAKEDLSFEAPRAFSTIKERLLGKELNAQEFKDFRPPFKEDAPAYRASTNEPLQYARVFKFSTEGGKVRSGKVGRWLFRRELLVDASGNPLPAAVIKDRLALDYLPTHICDVTMPANTEFWVGTVAPQGGAVGLMEQFYVKATELLKFGEDVPLTR